MLFRDPRPTPLAPNRFRADTVAFSFVRERHEYIARVSTNAESVVDLLHDLADHLPPAVTVTVRDLRHGTMWRSSAVALPDARDGIARMRVPLAQFGGVEVRLEGADGAVILTPHLELELRGTTDRWYYLLLGVGLLEATSIAPKRWTKSDRDWQPEPELHAAVALGVSRMGLEVA